MAVVSYFVPPSPLTASFACGALGFNPTALSGTALDELEVVLGLVVWTVVLPDVGVCVVELLVVVDGAEVVTGAELDVDAVVVEVDDGALATVPRTALPATVALAHPATSATPTVTASAAVNGRREGARPRRREIIGSRVFRPGQFL